MRAIIREKGFGYWFKEVFWYHYRFAFIAAIVALGVVIFIAVESAGEPSIDFTLVIAQGDTMLPYSAVEELEGVLETAVGDLDGDGEVHLNIQILNMSDSEYADSNVERLFLAFSLPEDTLFILDEDYSDVYCAKEGHFDALAPYGIEPDGDKPNRVSVNETPLFQRAGLSETPLYASICDWTTVGKGSQKLTDAAIRAIKAILETE